MKIIGWIGTGNMATALIQGIRRKSDNYAMIAYSPNLKQKKAYPAKAFESAREVAAGADILFLAVKPYKMAAVLEEIRTALKPDCLIVTIAVSLTLDWYRERLNSQIHLVRTLPNTCSQVGEGFTAVTFSDSVTVSEKAEILSLFRMTGTAEVIEEAQMNAASAMTGSSPALLYMIMEAMADAGVKNGLPRSQAYAMAAQAVKGAGAMALETGLHPGVLKDQVCSPAGSTIVGVEKAEQLGLRCAVLEAIDAIILKTNKIQE